MANKIKPRRSYTANATPLTTDLEAHEIAINWTDGKLFTKNASGQIVSITLGGSGGGSATDSRLDLFLPPAPTSVSGTSGNAQVTLTWTAPTVLAQTPITDYVVQYSSNSGSTWTTFSDGTSTTASATVTGLTNGTAYTFRVAAVNGIGTGAYSAASSAVTPVGGDTYFSNVVLLLHADSLTDSSGYGRTVTASGASVNTSTKKFGTGSFSIAGSGQYIAVPGATAFNMSGDYAIEWWQNLASASAQQWIFGGNANASGYFMLGLNLDASGQLWIGQAAVGWPVQFGSLTWTANTWQHVAVSRSGSTTRLYIDGTLAGTATNSTSWTANPNNIWIGSQSGGVSMSGYIDDLRWTVGSARGYTGSTITVPTSAFPDSGPPAAPTGLTATGGNTQAVLAWTAPYNGGSAITGYVVEYTPSGGSASTVNTGSSSASYTLTGLTDGTAYTVRVAAVNAIGTGGYSATASVTPANETSVLSVAIAGTGHSFSGAGLPSNPFVAATYEAAWGTGTKFLASANATVTLTFNATSYNYEDPFDHKVWGYNSYPTSSGPNTLLLAGSSATGTNITRSFSVLANRYFVVEAQYGYLTNLRISAVPS